jgi:ribose transport system substrate-binding protein
LCPRNTKAIGPVIAEANQAGIPVFTIDTICEDPNAKVEHHVGTDNFQGGHVAGQAMIDALGTGGGKVAVLEFTRVESCIDRVRGFQERIDQHNSTAANKIEIAGVYECGGAKEEGQNAARDALNAHPDLVGIFAINDPAALGARAALEAEGKADQIVVVGFDGQPEAKQAIKEGKLFDSPVQFPDRMAIESVKAILRYFDGETVEPVMLIPTEAYRKEQADVDPTLN